MTSAFNFDVCRLARRSTNIHIYIVALIEVVAALVERGGEQQEQEQQHQQKEETTHYNIA